MEHKATRHTDPKIKMFAAAEALERPAAAEAGLVFTARVSNCLPRLALGYQQSPVPQCSV